MEAPKFPSSEDPWVYANEVETLPLDQRYPYVLRWLDLVAMRDVFEQNCLLERGKRAFRFRVTTAKKVLKERGWEKPPRPTSTDDPRAYLRGIETLPPEAQQWLKERGGDKPTRPSHRVQRTISFKEWVALQDKGKPS